MQGFLACIPSIYMSMCVCLPVCVLADMRVQEGMRFRCQTVRELTLLLHLVGSSSPLCRGSESCQGHN